MDLLYKVILFPNKRKTIGPLFTDVPIRFYALHNLEADAAGNREIMKLVRTLISNRIIIRGYKYTIKTIHNQFLTVNSD